MLPGSGRPGRCRKQERKALGKTPVYFNECMIDEFDDGALDVLPTTIGMFILIGWAATHKGHWYPRNRDCGMYHLALKVIQRAESRDIPR